MVHGHGQGHAEISTARSRTQNREIDDFYQNSKQKMMERPGTKSKALPKLGVQKFFWSRSLLNAIFFKCSFSRRVRKIT